VYSMARIFWSNNNLWNTPRIPGSEEYISGIFAGFYMEGLRAKHLVGFCATNYRCSSGGSEYREHSLTSETEQQVSESGDKI